MDFDDLEALLRKAGFLRILHTLHAHPDTQFLVTRLIETSGMASRQVYRVLPALKNLSLVEEVAETYPRQYTWIRLTDKGKRMIEQVLALVGTLGGNI